MTPPKSPENKPGSTLLEYGFQEPFTFHTPLFEPVFDYSKPDQSSFLKTSPLLSSLGFPTVPVYSNFRIPGIYTPKFTSPVANFTPPPSPAKWRPSDTGQLITDIVMAIDSMDVDLNDMLVNGGEKGCRYSEVVTKQRYDAGKEKCHNQFEAGTYADAHVEVRPVEGKTFSEFHKFTVLYKKYPGRTGNRINGFFLTHPLDKNAEGPLKVDRDDPFESGKDFRDAANPSFDTPIGKSVPHSEKSSRLIMRPIGWLYDDAGPGVNFDISENMLKAWGILDKDIYKKLGVETFQLPRRLDRLWRLLPMPRPHNPDYILADGCYDKLPGAKYVRPNSINAKPDLIAWTAPKDLSAEIRFKKTSIPLGGRGHIDLGDGGVNRIKVKGDLTGLTVEIELKDIPSFRFNQGGYTIGAKGLKAGKVILKLPPLADIMKEFGSAPKSHADKTLDCEKKAELKAKAKKIAEAENRSYGDVLDQLEMEAIEEADAKTPKKDHSAFFEKLLGDIQVTGIEADELTFERPDRGLKATLVKPVIKSATVSGTKSFTFNGLAVDGLTLEDASTGGKASFGKSEIEKITVTRGAEGPIFDITGLEGSKLSFTRDEGGIVVDKGRIESVKVDMSKKDRVDFTMTDTTSNGKVDYKNPKEGYEFHTSGKSKLSLFTLNYEKNPGGDKIDTKIKFSGEINDFSVVHPQLGEFKLADTVLGESTFDLGLELPPAGSAGQAPKARFSVDVEVQKATLKSGHLPHVELDESKVTNGRIQLEKTESGLVGKVKGNLDLHIKEIDIPQVELATKGFTIEGVMKDIGIVGAGELEIGPELISLHKLEGQEKPGPLKITGTFSKLLFRDDPSVRKAELKKFPYAGTVKTEMDIAGAKLEIKDLEGFEFVRPDPATGRKPDLRKLKVNDISITQIQASAKIWAKFPIFGWLRGTFPAIGKIDGKLPDEKVDSELRLEKLDISTDSDGKTTQIVNLLIQLFEVGGQTQKAKFRLPSLTLSPKMITTGKDPIELELYFKDSQRGGDFEFNLEDEDLTHRGTRPKKKK